jgi:hypothetical protein
MTYYSPSAHAFCTDEARLPQDAVRITPARHRALLEGQAAGGTIDVGPDGHPRLIRAKKPTVADRRAAACRLVKRVAARRIDAASPLWRQLNDMRTDSPAGRARFAAIDTIRAASDAIEADIARTPGDALDALDIANHPLWSGKQP